MKIPLLVGALASDELCSTDMFARLCINARAQTEVPTLGMAAMVVWQRRRQGRLCRGGGSEALHSTPQKNTPPLSSPRCLRLRLVLTHRRSLRTTSTPTLLHLRASWHPLVGDSRSGTAKHFESWTHGNAVKLGRMPWGMDHENLLESFVIFRWHYHLATSQEHEFHRGSGG